MSGKCPNYSRNLEECNCTYEPCSRKGICCECIRYHRKIGELPACFFSDSTEKTFDRSPEALMRDLNRRA